MWKKFYAEDRQPLVSVCVILYLSTYSTYVWSSTKRSILRDAILKTNKAGPTYVHRETFGESTTIKKVPYCFTAMCSAYLHVRMWYIRLVDEWSHA